MNILMRTQAADEAARVIEGAAHFVGGCRGLAACGLRIEAQRARRPPSIGGCGGARGRAGRPTKVAAIALANKLARMAWAMMAKGEHYKEPAALAA